MPFNFDELAPNDRDLCERLADHYAVLELQLLCEQSLAVVRASLQELQSFEKATKEGNEPKPFRISLNVAQRHSRNLADLILERRNAQLCFFNDCNNELGEKSPFKDDVVARRHGHLANYDVIEVKPSRRRARSGVRQSGIGNRISAGGRDSVGSLQSAAGSHSAGSDTAAGADVEPGAQVAGGLQADVDTPQDTGVEPSEEVRRLYSAWADAFEEWEKQGDKFAPLPEYPPELLQGMKELSEKNPLYANHYKRGQGYISHREELMKRVNQLKRMKQAQGGAAPATS